MGGGLFRRAVVVVAFATALFALPQTALAVLSGTNGRILFTSGRDAGGDAQAKIFFRTIVGSAGGGVASAAITPPGGQYRHPTWSPDRTKIAWANGTPGSAATENFDIFIQDLVNPSITPITDTGDSLSADRPAWSPDGTRIAYEHQPTDNSTERDIRVRTVGSLATVNLTTGAPNESKPAWSPNSQTIYYTSGDPNANSNIVSEPAGGGAVTLALPDSGISEFQPSISPDGTKICFTLGVAFDGTTDVFTAALATPATQTNLSDNTGTMAQHGDYNCTWSPDGTKIAYAMGTFGSGALVMENSDDSSLGPQPLEDAAGVFDGNPDWAPDGRPTCQDATVDVNVNTAATIPLTCADTGPAYEQTGITIDTPADAGPANGTLGTVAQGPPASVVYTPNANFTGTDTFQVRVRDGVAFGTQRAIITVRVVTPTGPGGGGGADTTRPNVTSVSLSSRKWKRSAGLPQLSATKVGTRIRWRLSESARTTLTFQRALRGRRVGGRCLKPTRARRGRKACTRFRDAGSLTAATAKAGLNTLAFKGRLTNSRRLGLGRYRVSLRAVDAANNRSLTRRSATFRIVAR